MAGINTNPHITRLTATLSSRVGGQLSKLECFVMKRWIIQLIVFTTSSPLFAEDPRPLSLGSGEPGLHIIYNTTNNHPTYQYVIFLDEPWTVGDGLIGGMDERQIQVILDHNYGLKERLQSRTERMGIPEQLYPFDDKTVFTCEGDAKFPNNRAYKTNSMGISISDDGKTLGFPRVTAVFSTNTERILISDDVYTMARLRYGLTTNQLFLGKFGTNIFFWETQNATMVYYQTAEGARTTNYFKLPKRVIDIYGVTKSVSTNMDVGFYTFSKSTGWFHFSSYTFEFIEVSFKNGKQVGSTK
jgi:hypothetical protein